MSSPDLVAAREHFLTLIADVRPDLHRYASRLVGSAIDGEDVVQEVLAKAFYALTLAAEPPVLRPWLFRIARNTALDFLRRYERTHAEAFAEEPSVEPAAPPEAMRAALATFLALPPTQRSAVILKDVLGESLEDIAGHLDTSVEAVKALLVRGRKRLAVSKPQAHRRSEDDRETLERYVALFNARDWEGVQRMLLDDVQLDLVAKSHRRGKAVGAYFGRYAQETGNTLTLGWIDDRLAIGLFRDGVLTNVIFLETSDGKIASIRDFRYVPYLAGAVAFEAA